MILEFHKYFGSFNGNIAVVDSNRSCYFGIAYRIWLNYNYLNVFTQSPSGALSMHIHLDSSMCKRTVHALTRLCECAGSSEPSLFAYAICTIIS